MSAELECLSCGATVPVVPYTTEDGHQHVRGTCACQLTMTADPNAFRESRGYYEYDGKLRVDYARDRFGPPYVHLQIFNHHCGTEHAPLVDVLRRVIKIVRSWDEPPKPIDAKVSDREAKRRARAQRG